MTLVKNAPEPDRLSKEYNRTVAVDDVSLTIEPDHMLALLADAAKRPACA